MNSRDMLNKKKIKNRNKNRKLSGELVIKAQERVIFQQFLQTITMENAWKVTRRICMLTSGLKVVISGNKFSQLLL